MDRIPWVFHLEKLNLCDAVMSLWTWVHIGAGTGVLHNQPQALHNWIYIDLSSIKLLKHDLDTLLTLIMFEIPVH